MSGPVVLSGLGAIWLVVLAAGIALAGLAFHPRSVRECPPGLTTAFMEYRPAGAMMRFSP